MPRSSTTWKKGQSGNPRGREPTGQSFAALLRDVGDQTHAKGGTYRERLVQMAWEQACMGDHAARVWIVDRLEGRVTDKVKQEVTLTGALLTDDGDRLTEQERAAVREALTRSLFGNAGEPRDAEA